MRTTIRLTSLILGHGTAALLTLAILTSYWLSNEFSSYTDNAAQAHTAGACDTEPGTGYNPCEVDNNGMSDHDAIDYCRAHWDNTPTGDRHFDKCYRDRAFKHALAASF